MKKKLILSVLATLFGLLMLEGFLGVYLSRIADLSFLRKYGSVEQLEAWMGPPKLEKHAQLQYVTVPDYRSRDNLNRHNALGFRGEDVTLEKDEGVTRIVCIGGSTTYSEGVHPYPLSYPFLLQAWLMNNTTAKVEVINAGVSGYSSKETLINFEKRVLPLDPDILLIYHGINDIYGRLVWPPEAFVRDGSGVWNYTGTHPLLRLAGRSHLLRMIFVRMKWMEPAISYTASLVSLADTAYSDDLNRQLTHGSYPEGVFETVSLHRMLKENDARYFEQNMRQLIDRAREEGVKPLLISFAVQVPAPGNQALSLSAFQDALEEHNRVVRRMAADTGTQLIDLQAALHGDPDLFTDGVHFNAAGNGARARVIGQYLLDQVLPQLTR